MYLHKYIIIRSEYMYVYIYINFDSCIIHAYIDRSKTRTNAISQQEGIYTYVYKCIYVYTYIMYTYSPSQVAVMSL